MGRDPWSDRGWGISTSAYMPALAGAPGWRSSLTRTVWRVGSAMGKTWATRAMTTVSLGSSSLTWVMSPGCRGAASRVGTSTWPGAGPCRRSQQGLTGLHRIALVHVLAHDVAVEGGDALGVLELGVDLLQLGLGRDQGAPGPARSGSRTGAGWRPAGPRGLVAPKKGMGIIWLIMLPPWGVGSRRSRWYWTPALRRPPRRCGSGRWPLPAWPASRLSSMTASTAPCLKKSPSAPAMS
jgi:hypothetical protein